MLSGWVELLMFGEFVVSPGGAVVLLVGAMVCPLLGVLRAWA